MNELTLAPGTLVGNYRVVRRLGSGGMGAVYEVEHIRLGVRYALKVFAAEGRNADFLRKRFLAEGRLLARLDHPRIVRVYDMDVADGFVWFTMDYVEGPDGQPRTLADVPQAGVTDETQIAAWYDDVREALEVVHAAGIVHRDVKLENILVGRDGRAVLSDFGISRIVDDNLRRQLDVTRTMVAKDTEMKVVLGTAAYLAPEIRTGNEPTAAADAYALGIAFFRLLTGLWYEPGPHAFDLLAPFSRRWRTLFAALLAEEPTARTAPCFAIPKPRGVAKRLLAALLLVLLAAAVGLACRFFTWESETPVATPVEADDPFSIPASIK